MDVHSCQRQHPVNEILHPVIYKIQSRSRKEQNGIVFKVGFQQFLIAVLDGEDAWCHQPAGIAANAGAKVLFVSMKHLYLQPFAGELGRLLGVALQHLVNDRFLALGKSAASILDGDLHAAVGGFLR